ncbi:MAG: AAA family ATPase [Minisyncoccia bacterium]
MIIGITGTLGAGKGAVVEYLVNTLGFEHYSMSGFITEEIERRELVVNRDTMSLVANDLRAEHGPGYIASTLLARAKAASGNALIEALHSTGEAEEIKKGGGIIIAVDADLKTRFERIRGRGSEKDDVTFEHFKKQNEREIASADPTRHNIAGVMKMADYTLTNEGTLTELYAQIDRVLEQIKK